MRKHGKVDANQREIVQALRDCGASVLLISSLGGGTGDIIAGIYEVNFLMEIKMPGEKLTPDEIKWHEQWKGQKAVVYSVADALAVIGAKLQ